ncbi:MAG: UvrD-helicase domain-containing protein, partial [bacterium]
MPSEFNLNKEQQDAVNHQIGPLLIIAGAGTGKTRVICETIRKLISQDGVSPKNILAL